MVYRVCFSRKRYVLLVIGITALLSVFILSLRFHTPHGVFLYFYGDSFLEDKYRRILLETLKEFDKTWRERYGLKYALYAGSVLGAYRHGGIIPFDDDVDVVVHLKYQKNVSFILKDTRLKIFGNKQLNLRLKDKDLVHNRYVDWPYMDLFFYYELGDEEIVINDLRYPKDIFLPFTYLPFENHMFPVPHCPLKYLRHTFGLNVLEKCCTHGMNHRTQALRIPLCTNCQNLYSAAKFMRWPAINQTHHQAEIHLPGARVWFKGFVLPKGNCDSN